MLVLYSKLATANSVTVKLRRLLQVLLVVLVLVTGCGTQSLLPQIRFSFRKVRWLTGVSGVKTKEKERGSLLTAAGRLADHVAPALLLLLLQVALLLADQDQHIMSGPPRLQVAHRRK